MSIETSLMSMKWINLLLLLFLSTTFVMAQDEEVEDIYSSLQRQGRSSLTIRDQFSWRGTLSNGTPVCINIETNWENQAFGKVRYTRKDGTCHTIPFFGMESADGESLLCHEYVRGKVVGNWFFELQNVHDLKKAAWMATGGTEKEYTLTDAVTVEQAFDEPDSGLINEAPRPLPLTTFGLLTDECHGKMTLSIKGKKATWSVSLARPGTPKATLSGSGVSRMTGNTFEGQFAGIRFTAYCFANAVFFDVWRGPDAAFDFKGFFGML